MAFCVWWNVAIFCLLCLILNVTDELNLPNTPRACVIGAGYSGMGTGRFLKQYGVEFTVFEATRHIGGIWRFNPHVGADEDGLPVFTCVYKNLRTNSPRETMEYSDFKFPKGAPSYPTGTCFYKYLKNFAKHFDLLKYIQLRSLVTSVKWTGNHWNLTYTKTDTKNNHTETCDFVVVANGAFTLPVWPNIPELAVFKGNMKHSYDFKDSEVYRNRRVLLVGAGASGLDLAIHLIKVASKVIHSHHLVYNQPNLPNNYIKKPDIKKFTPYGAVFQDDSTADFDDVIFCTGYNFAHPFLDESAGVKATAKYVLPLYQQIVNINHPSMIFVGISKKIINRVNDAQAQYAAALAAGRFKLPSRETMLRNWFDHVNSLPTKNRKIMDINVITEMDEYFQNLTREAQVIQGPPVLMKIFDSQNRLDNLLHYRDYDYEIIDDYNYKRIYNPRTDIFCPFDG